MGKGQKANRRQPERPRQWKNSKQGQLRGRHANSWCRFGNRRADGKWQCIWLRERGIYAYYCHPPVNWNGQKIEDWSSWASHVGTNIEIAKGWPQIPHKWIPLKEKKECSQVECGNYATLNRKDMLLLNLSSNSMLSKNYFVIYNQNCDLFVFDDAEFKLINFGWIQV
jgi:hypothetical protein